MLFLFCNSTIKCLKTTRYMLNIVVLFAVVPTLDQSGKTEIVHGVALVDRCLCFYCITCGSSFWYCCSTPDINHDVFLLFCFVRLPDLLNVAGSTLDSNCCCRLQPRVDNSGTGGRLLYIIILWSNGDCSGNVGQFMRHTCMVWEIRCNFFGVCVPFYFRVFRIFLRLSTAFVTTS